MFGVMLDRDPNVTVAFHELINGLAIDSTLLSRHTPTIYVELLE